MKNICLILACILSVLLPKSSPAITTEELAQFLGIHGWKTVVDLPAESYSIEIWEFRNGELVDRWIMSNPDMTRNSEAGISVLTGPYEDKYKLSISFSAGGTLGVKTRVPLFATTFAAPFPEKLKEGDFVFLAEPKKTETKLGQNDLKRYAQGFMLRIQKLK